MFEKSSGNVSQPVGSVNPQGPAGPQRGEKGHLLRAAGLMSLMTLFSRVLGMARDVVSAKAFGTSWQWDAFLYAFMLPNFFRRIVGEGAFSSAFIPVYAETLHQKSTEEAFRFVNNILTLLASGLLLLLLIAEAGFGILLKSGHLNGTLLLTCELSRTLFPYLLFMSVYALFMGILNSHRHFLMPAVGPLLLNILWIGGTLAVMGAFGGDMARQVHVMAWVLLVAGALQMIIQIPPLLKLGFRMRPVWDLASTQLKKVGALMLPSLLGFAVFQINIMVDMSLSLAIGEGANSSLWYGTRLMQFPLGVFAIAMGSALLPTISRQTAQKNHDEARKTLSFALRVVFLIIIPCAFGLIVMAKPIVRMLFERGHFDALSTHRTAAVLVAYSIGLFAYSGQKIITTAFYAAQDTRTPVTTGIVALITNVCFNLILMGPLKEAGLALATSLSGLIQFFTLMVLYNRRITALEFSEVWRSFLKITAASAAMALSAFFVFRYLEHSFSGGSTSVQLLQVGGSIGCAVVTYLVFCFLFRVDEMKSALRMISARYFEAKKA
ncbi:MAG: murein biosynthesis integral membrane protein MurJ [Candidatus Omnitrophica bacterium]|nr:murein biosynthesis integral membrane protein MurJ [Candidatus Omnitrophota bacterium]